MVLIIMSIAIKVIIGLMVRITIIEGLKVIIVAMSGFISYFKVVVIIKELMSFGNFKVEGLKEIAIRFILLSL